MILPCAIRCLRLLPRKVQTSLYYRVLARHKAWFEPAFASASLKLQPEIRMRLAPGDQFHGEIALFGIYEDEVSKRIHEIARSTGGLMVDVGANYGYYSLLWCGGSLHNRSFAIEPSVPNLTALRKNIALNGFDDRITVHDWAASNDNGVACFDPVSTQESGWGGLTNYPSSLGVSVQTRRLDDALPQQGIELLKIDCEGADALVVEGAAQLLQTRRIKHVFFEENLRRQTALGIALGAAVRQLTSHGYHWEKIGGESLICNYHARCSE